MIEKIKKGKKQEFVAVLVILTTMDEQVDGYTDENKGEWKNEEVKKERD